MTDINFGHAIFQLGILQISQNTNLEANISRKGAAWVQSVHIFWYSSSAITLSNNKEIRQAKGKETISASEKTRMFRVLAWDFGE